MTCPFCGVFTNVPHETQGACIDALHAEIGRMRTLLHRNDPPAVAGEPRTAETDPGVLTRPV